MKYELNDEEVAELEKAPTTYSQRDLEAIDAHNKFHSDLMNSRLTRLKLNS